MKVDKHLYDALTAALRDSTQLVSKGRRVGVNSEVVPTKINKQNENAKEEKS